MSTTRTRGGKRVIKGWAVVDPASQNYNMKWRRYTSADPYFRAAIFITEEEAKSYKKAFALSGKVVPCEITYKFAPKSNLKVNL